MNAGTTPNRLKNRSALNTNEKKLYTKSKNKVLKKALEEFVNYLSKKCTYVVKIVQCLKTAMFAVTVDVEVIQWRTVKQK